VLYRDERPFYVGKTKGRLYSRIWGHANRPGAYLYNFWNFVSAFVVPEPNHVDQIEGVLITTMRATMMNKATPKIKRIPFPVKSWKTAKERKLGGGIAPKVKSSPTHIHSLKAA
jgi:hypothetical protein